MTRSQGIQNICNQMTVLRGDLEISATEKIRVDRENIISCFGIALIILFINYLQREDLH